MPEPSMTTTSTGGGPVVVPPHSSGSSANVHYATNKQSGTNKEMVGGCCICADENGWTGNPLVYCDGEKCDVAVHQGCYGIVQVPDGPWLCARCSALPKSNTAQCRLCPIQTGALKRTDSNGWAHVICALYIPEVTFGDVNSMDPVITSDIPESRFNQICYLCEQRNPSDQSTARSGACMQCNRQGCKKYFHVTCAQSEGLLCEEGGSTQNVRYCGYCTQHAKKAATDPSVKIVPAYRSQQPSTSSGHSTPDLYGVGSSNSTRLKDEPRPKQNGRPNSTSNIGMTTPGVTTPLRTSTTNVTSMFDPTVTITNQLVNHSAASSNTPMANGPISSTAASIPASFNLPPQSAASWSTSNTTLNGPMNALAEVASLTTAGGQSTNGSTVATTSGLVNSDTLLPGTSESNIVTTATAGGLVGLPHKTDHQQPKDVSGKRGRPPGSTSRSHLDGDDRPKRPRKNTKRTVKTLLELVDPVVQDCVSDFQRDRDAQRQTVQTGPGSMDATSPTIPTPGGSVGPTGLSLPPAGALNVLGATPQPQTDILTGLPAGLPPTDTPFQMPAPSSAGATSVSAAGGSGTGAVGVPLKPTPKLGLVSPDAQAAVLAAGSSSAGNAAYPTSLEQLLERQWEQGSQFLMEQAQHFDIASLLSCLNQLKVENQRLEDSIVSLASRRDHLLAVNARLTLTLGQSQAGSTQSPLASPRAAAAPQVVSGQPTAHVQPATVETAMDSSPGSALVQLRNLATTSTSISPASQTSTKAAQTQGLPGHPQATTMLSPPGRAGSTAATAPPPPPAGLVNGGLNVASTAPQQPFPSLASSTGTTTATTIPGGLSTAHYYPAVSQSDQLFHQMLMQQTLTGLGGYGNLAAAANLVASSNAGQTNPTKPT